MRNFLILLLLTVALPAHAIKIQQQGIVSQSDCSARGIANSVCLPLDNQIFVSALGLDESLDVAITNGAFSGASNSSLLFGNSAIFPSVATNALTVALLTAGGSPPSSGSPVSFYFRSNTATVGQYFNLIVTANLSVVVPAGGTLGQVSGVPTSTYVYVQALSGNVQMCVSSNPALDEGTLQTSVTVSSGATSRTALYCAVGGTGPVRRIGRFLSTQATAGQWATAPSAVGVAPFDRPIAQNQLPYGIEYASSQTSCTSSPCTLVAQSGGVSQVTRAGTGTYSLVLNSGVFSGPMTCTCMSALASNTVCQISGNATSTNFFFETVVASTGSAIDSNAWNITCMGPK